MTCEEGINAGLAGGNVVDGREKGRERGRQKNLDEAALGLVAGGMFSLLPDGAALHYMALGPRRQEICSNFVRHGI